MGPALSVALVAGVVVGVCTAPFGVGVLVVLGVVLVGLPLGEVERRRLRLMLTASPVVAVHRRPPRPGLRTWVGTRMRERQTWWELGYALLFAGPLWMVDVLVVGVPLLVCGILLATPWLRHVDGGRMVIVDRLVVDSTAEAWTAAAVGAGVLLVVTYMITAYAGARAVLARTLLAPVDPRAGMELVRAKRSRARLVAAFEGERRRIERDLHDGAQQQLLRVSVELGLARLEVPDTLAAGDLPARLDRASGHARQAMADLRELVHGIHPRVLTERGLAAAVAAAADRVLVPVEVDVEVPRLAAPVESAVYFAVCEAFANIGKHARADKAWVRGWMDAGRLVVEVGDDGVGGARAGDGSGLVGLADRLSVVEGVMLLSSPPGGPTLLRMEVPCAGFA
jgi:signal transduction histidine kinase